MGDFLAGWRAVEVIALVSVVGVLVWFVTWVIAHHWRSVRLAEIDAGMKHDFLQRGLSIDEIERLLRAPSAPAKNEKPVNELELDANLASLLVQYEVSSSTMEQVVRTFQAAEASNKKAVYDAIEEMLENGAEEEQLATAVRMLCTPRAREVVAVMG